MKHLINCKGKLVDLSTPKVMGILNVTPDSFYDGGKHYAAEVVLERVSQMLAEGADFIDIGACSTKPGASEVSEVMELERLLPMITLLMENFPDLLLSVDTFRASVAEKAILAGACMVNDIAGGDMDGNMFEIIVKYQVPYVLMHMQGTPQTMQEAPVYENVVKEVYKSLSKKIVILHNLHVHDVLVDVGFGFGKSLVHNYELLQHLAYFKNLGVPILTGISRKSMLYKPLGITPKEALNATTVANTIALLNGTQILRVHDVKAAVEAVKIVSLTQKQ